MEYRDELYKKAKYSRVYRYANELLATTNYLTGFPFKVKEFIYETTDLYVWSNRKFKSHFNMDVKDFGSEAAVLLELCGFYYIIYNEFDSTYRIRFSILHELGHYVLGHNMNLSKNDELYWLQEMEANCFAAQLLMPEQLLRKIQEREVKITENLLTRYFAVSKEAAQNRINTLAKTNKEWKSREESQYDDIIILRYGSIIEKIAPAKVTISYDFEYEYERQQERDSWFNDRR